VFNSPQFCGTIAGALRQFGAHARQLAHLAQKRLVFLDALPSAMRATPTLDE